ncbi:TonB-dependent receptor [Psychromonas marina]|uniref:TonB-dependent receptor n=1 Tax=Psychromonas marina TaxID=88364 RepID=A0ABQ6E186_9GAMM|nr:TonB-dependent hemoglobin/transferrin/lactoferrin family receptor [Psychromonas marina]GLS91075.1 TonB-dependent receptor [Psychromonas marina]
MLNKNRMFSKNRLAVCVAIAISSSVSADEAVFSFDEVQVSATRSQQSIQDTAASVAVISDKTIEKDMINNVADLFDYTPGVDIESDSRQGVQGISIRGISGNRIKIIVDGVSQADQFENEYSFINSGRVDVDMDMLKSVEVVKGAASSLQGSDAIGGIVAFTTKGPSDFLSDDKNYGGHLKLNYSSADNSFSESVALANRLGKLETLVAYSRKDGHEVDNFGSPDKQDNEANNLLVKLQYQFNETNRLEFTGEYVNSSIDTELTDDSYTNYAGDDQSDRYRIGLKHILTAKTAIFDELTWQIDYLAKEQNSITDRTFVSSGNEQTKDYVYSDKGVQADIQLDKFFSVGNSEHYLVYGASFESKDISNTNLEYNSGYDDQEIFYMPEASELNYGFFVQDEIVINDLILTPGVRFDSFSTNPGDNLPESGYDTSLYNKYSDSAVTGRLGALYSVSEHHKLFAQVSQGFRAPDFQELFYSYGNPTHGYESIPNPELEAEESISYELGWRIETEASFTEFAVYYSDYDNFIDYQFTGVSDGLYQYQYINIDKATIKGAEVSNTLDWHRLVGTPEGISTRFAAAYTEGEDGEGNALNSINPWNAVVGLNYDQPAGKWGTSLKIAYTAKKKQSDVTATTDFMGNENDMFTPDSSTVVDLTAYYVPIEDLTLRAGLFNLTDEKYYNWSDVNGLQEEDDYYTQAGRNFSITAKYLF